jgi:hypothetical protein
MTHANALNKILFDKLLSGAFGKLAIKAYCKELVDTAGGDGLPLITAATNSCRDMAASRCEILLRMRPKGHQAR